MSPSLSRAYGYCQWLTAHHYENFPVASWLLPRSLRPHVAAIYAFARTADDFSDEESDPERALARLRRWGQALERCVEGRAEHPVFAALAETMRTYQLPVQLFRDLLTAFSRDVTVKRYATWTSLQDDYCRYSANPVGRLVLLLFGYRDPALHLLSDHMCTALQLTNFWQDLAIDLRKDRIYVPREALARHGVSEASLFAHTTDEPFRALMAEACGMTEELFRRAAPLPGRVRGRLTWELAATWHGGMTILQYVRAADYDTFGHRPTLSAWDRVRLGLRVLGGNGHAPAG